MSSGWYAISACMTCFSLERTIPVLSQYNRSISRIPCHGLHGRDWTGHQGQMRMNDPGPCGSACCHVFRRMLAGGSRKYLWSWWSQEPDLKEIRKPKAIMIAGRYT